MASPWFCDASSDFLSREVDVKRYGMIYAGAQKKHAGPGRELPSSSIRKEFSGKSPHGKRIDDFKLSYPRWNHVQHSPGFWRVFSSNLVLEWIENQGGIKAVEQG